MLFPACIVDNFLGPGISGELLKFALAHEADFKPSAITSQGETIVKSATRMSLSFNGDLTAIIAPFAAAIDRECDRLRAETGADQFARQLSDLDLVAHCDGHRFKRHVDTTTSHNRMLVPADRVLSLVYYLHTEPQRFSGGNLVLHALLGDERRVIEPRHDRLVAFPSIAPHEVEPIRLPGNAFADARFSLVCWLGRQRSGEPPAA